MTYLRGEQNQQVDCVFCITSTEDDTRNHVLYRGEYCFIILNRFPYNTGHLMIIPYVHVSTLEALDSDTLTEMTALTQLSLRILREAYGPQGFNLGMNIGQAAGAGVTEHVHLHIVPRWEGDTNYMTVVGQTRVIPEWLDQMYAKLRPLFERDERNRMTEDELGTETFG
jgi:ATP adenylyltransferase